MKKWIKIKQLSNVIKTVNHISEFNGIPLPAITYKAKIKIHGTNAGIEFNDGKITAQGRKRKLSIDSDNYQFAAWVEQIKSNLERLKVSNKCIIHGEWFGRGIQRGVSCSQIDRKCFGIFAVEIFENDKDLILIDPEKISNFLKPILIEGIYVLPWYGDSIIFDFANNTDFKKSVNIVVDTVKKIEELDPWIKDTFGITGIGEGVVMYPYTTDFVDRSYLEDTIFKAKGKKHSVSKVKSLVPIDIEVVKDIENFVKMVCTEARLEQGFSEVCQENHDVRKTGEFIKWVMNDILEECKEEIVASGLNWKRVSKVIATKASNFFKSKGLL
jgi:hypothetical protein